jgi:hypothetical protein
VQVVVALSYLLWRQISYIDNLNPKMLHTTGVGTTLLCGNSMKYDSRSKLWRRPYVGVVMIKAPP